MAAAPDPQGYLVVKVLEVTGKSKDEEPVWDSSLNEAFVKIEIRGGARTVKKQTTVQPVVDGLITFEEQLALEILEGAKELRIMLCRQRKSDTRAGTSVIAACGIYVQDILEAVPIDKFFDLFKPGMGAEGGFVRVSMSYVPADQATGNGALLEAGGGRAAQRKRQKRGLPLLKIAAVVVLGFAAYRLWGMRKDKKKDEQPKAAAGKKK